VATRYDGTTDSLRLNLFKPVGDGQTERPLVIVIHGGGFINGHRNEMNDLCQGMASMGWAVATISYRLGYYGTGILDAPYAYDGDEFSRAIYRAMQDTKGAIRFLKERHLQDSTSTTNVLLTGFSAGGFAALHAAYLDTPEEKPVAAGAIGDVQHFFNIYQRPDLGPIDGTLNQNGHDASVLGLASIFGGLLDVAMIESADDPALYMYHQTGDPVVGCGVQQPYWGIPLGPSGNLPWTFGSCAIDTHVQGLDFAPGRYQFHLHNGNDHDIHDPMGVMVESLQWMRELFCGANVSVEEVSGRSLALFPNPSDGRFTLVLPEGEQVAHVQVFDRAGARVAEFHLRDGVMDLGHLADGVYVMRVVAARRVWIERVVIGR
jgi:para-nitrobenzyl esterase